MELLAPAGNWDSLIAAIAAGADAIYLGYTAFGARSYAGNFDEKKIVDAIHYAHRYGRRIYVTVNTLVKENELQELRNVLKVLNDAQADAVLVQDLGVLSILQKDYPALSIHASTQMTINNVQGALLVKKYGVERVVPARECSLNELELVAKKGIEVEAFVHGALCVSVSGQCLFSSLVGGRSGNRGKCAQPCRLPYSLQDGTKGYLLSTRDLMLIERIPDLLNAGIASLKIEGRMKRPEYVSVVTSIYRKAIDEAQSGRIWHPSAEDIISLKQIFNRGGFTEGYVMGQSHAAIMNRRYPGHQGIEVGEVISVSAEQAKIQTSVSVHKGDILFVEGKIEAFTYTGPSVKKGQLLSLLNKDLHKGMKISRLTSIEQLEWSKTLRPVLYPKVPVYAVLTARLDEYPSLTFKDYEGHEVTITDIEYARSAEGTGIDEASAKKQIGKLGDSIFILNGFEMLADKVFLPASQMNRMRRNAVQAMLQKRHSSIIEYVNADCKKTEQRSLTAVTDVPEQIGPLFRSGADRVIFSPRNWDLTSLKSYVNKISQQVILELPQVLETQELKDIFEFVSYYKDKFCGVQLNNIGQFYYHWPVAVSGGLGLNIMNHLSAAFYFGLGAKRLTISCELNAKEISLLQDQGNFEVECYGRTQLMLLTHCPIRTNNGDTKLDHRCRICQPNNGWCEILTDRYGAQFPLRSLWMKNKCLVSVYNSVYTDMSKQASVLKRLNCSLRLSFTDESEEDRLFITNSYRHFMDGDNSMLHHPRKSDTTGHLMRGVE